MTPSVRRSRERGGKVFSGEKDVRKKSGSPGGGAATETFSPAMERLHLAANVQKKIEGREPTVACRLFQGRCDGGASPQTQKGSTYL